jgi:hypothetical protein
VRVDVIDQELRQAANDLTVMKPRRLAHNQDAPDQLNAFVRQVHVTQLVRGHEGARRHGGNVDGLGGHSKRNLNAAAERRRFV